MVIKLGINGFGRIGRVIFRAGVNKADLEVIFKNLQIKLINCTY